MFERFTDQSRRVVVLAQEEARMLNHNYIGTEHILLGLLREREGVAAQALVLLGISLKAVRLQVEEVIGQGQEAPSGHIPFTPRAKRVLQEAPRVTGSAIDTGHLLLAILNVGESDPQAVARQVLDNLGTESNVVRQRVNLLLNRDYRAKERAATVNVPVATVAAAGVEVAALATPLLDQVGRNLTRRAREGKLDPVIGREKEIERVVQVLSRRTKNNPVLAGAPGIGKTSIVEGLAEKIGQGAVPVTLQAKQLYAIDLDVLRDASASQADSDTRVRAMLGEIRDRGDIILFISELQNLWISSGTAGWIDVGSPLISALVRGDVQVIGTTSLPEVQSRLSTDPTFLRTLVPLPVTEPTIEQTIMMLRGGLRDRYEEHHRVSITDDAVTAAVELSARLQPDQRLPSKAVDLIDEAAAQLYVLIPGVLDFSDYDARIMDIRRHKEAAIDAQDFGKAADLRDVEKQVLAEKAVREMGWKRKGVEVTEELVAETLAGMLGRTVADIMSSTPPPLFAPAAMTDDDREVWALALCGQTGMRRAANRRVGHAAGWPDHVHHDHRLDLPGGPVRRR
jgi:ATP-dependent Clp protease ATP-binding subunit ClpC